MLRFLLLRLGATIPTLIGISLLAFLLIHLVPGDPIEIRSGERGISAERLSELRHRYGLDQPLWRQFLVYEQGVATGDLGRSITTNNSVAHEFLTLLPATIELSLMAMMIAVALGIPIGVIAAVKRGTSLDHGLMMVALTGYSMPIFWWGALLILFSSITLGLTPISGRIAEIYDIAPRTGFMLIDSIIASQPGAFGSAVKHLILPAIVLGTIPLAVIARMTRSAMLEILSADFIRTARAKGLSEFRVIFIHALRNALIPVVTIIGLQIGMLLGGAILTETIFAWPGIGKWLVDAIARRDYPVLQGGVLLIACLVILVNLTVDLGYGWLNPKIRAAVK